MQQGGKISKILRTAFFAAAFTGAFIFAGQAEAASLYLSPAAATYRLGETFQISMYVSSADQAMNAAQAGIAFPTDKLEVISVSTKNSIFSLMVENPTFSNVGGSANFSGIVLNPGYTGKSGKLVTVNFRAKALGTAKVSITGAEVLANDGSGTNILSSRGSGTYSIIEKKITPPAPPKPLTTPTPAEVQPTSTPATTTLEVPTAPCVTTTVYLVTSSVCTVGELPSLFMKIGTVTFDTASLSLLFLILMILVSAVVSFWGFFEAYVHEPTKERKTKKKI